MEQQQRIMSPIVQVERLDLPLDSKLNTTQRRSNLTRPSIRGDTNMKSTVGKETSEMGRTTVMEDMASSPSHTPSSTTLLTDTIVAPLRAATAPTAHLFPLNNHFKSIPLFCFWRLPVAKHLEATSVWENSYANVMPNDMHPPIVRSVRL